MDIIKCEYSLNLPESGLVQWAQKDLETREIFHVLQIDSWLFSFLCLNDSTTIPVTIRKMFIPDKLRGLLFQCFPAVIRFVKNS